MEKNSELVSVLKEILDELKRINGNAVVAEPDRWMTVKETAAYLGRTRQTLSSYARRGYLHPVYRCGQKGYMLSSLKSL